MNTNDRNLRLPTGALIIAAIAVSLMAIWSIVQWPDMAPTIVTREAGGHHGASVVPRGVTAAAMPALLAILTALLAVTVALDTRLMKRILTTPQQDPGRGAPRVLGASLVGLSILLGTLHVVLIGMYTGAHLPAEQAVPVAVGVLLAILGIYLPLARPNTTHASETLESFRAAQGPAYRIGGFALVIVGLATVASGIVLPWLAMTIAVAGVALVFVGIIVSSLVRALRASRA